MANPNVIRSFLPALLLFSAVPLRAGPAAYEEDLLAQMRLREDQWRQMKAYADSLPRTAPLAKAPSPAGPAVEARRAAFCHDLGYPAPGFLDRPDARFVKVGEDDEAVYYRCWIRATRQMDTYGLYLVPRKARFPAPLVIAMHGGGGFPELATFHGGSNYHDMVRGIVRRGWIAFAPLAVMYPYRDRDHGTAIPEDARDRIDARLRESGTTLMGVEVTKFDRALDVLTRRPEVDSRRIAMIGLSYGGFYTLYMAAVDPRIGAAVASCSFRDRSPGEPVFRDENDIRGSCELVELISPRPLQVQCGSADPIFSAAGARRAAEKARAYYPGPASGNFDFEVFPGKHEFRGDVAWPFLVRHLD